MPAIPLAIRAYSRTAAFQPETVCQNMYLEEDKSGASPDKFMRIDRPGLSDFVTLGSNVRGLFRQEGLFGGFTYATAGTRLYSITSGASVDLGSIGAGDRTPFAANYEKLFVLSALVPFAYDGATVAGITMPDTRDVADIDVLNNFLILACPDGRFYWLDPGSGTVDPLDFATAESSPDGLIAVRVLGDEAIFFGQTRGEVWQTTGDEDAPFLRAGGRNFDRGCMARDACLRYDNSIVWPGDDGIVYRYGAVPTRISDHGIEERIRNRTGELSACIAEADGHRFYVLKIPGQGSFAYDAATRMWSRWKSDGADEFTPHVSTAIGEEWIVGDEDSGAIWRLDPDATTDDGAEIERIVSGTIPLIGLPARNDSLAIGAGGSADFTLQVRWRDGQEAFPSEYEEMEVRAPADVISFYRLGIPDQPFRTFELRITDAVKARISGAVANEAWG